MTIQWQVSLLNSLIIGIGTGVISCVLATMAAVGILKYRVKSSKPIAGLYLSPLFIAHILIGISSLMFNKTLLRLPGNVFSAIIANTTFREITFPLVWPAILGAFIVSFLLSLNNLEISFYNLGATPTLPTLAWGSLRYGVSQELYALAALINMAVFAFLGALYFLLKTGRVRLDYKD